MSIIELDYNITTEPIYLHEQNSFGPDLIRDFELYHRLSLEGKRSSVKKIKDAIEQYPNHPQFKNYLYVLYSRLKEKKKMFEVNRWIIEEHPNYLFGKLNLATEFYQKEEYDKMPEILGKGMELKLLYPHRQTFHITEVMSFYKCAILYFTAIGNFEQAQIRYNIMYELAPNSPDTEFVNQQILNASLLVAQKRIEEEKKNKIVVQTKTQEIGKTTEAPHFNHKEVECLYSNDFSIGEEKINTILSLPKESLIQDLELALQDSINRYGYFKKIEDENGWDSEKMSFVIHSLSLLGELKATQSLDVIFNVLSQSDEYLELYIDDLMTELMWEIMYKIVINELEACKQFMFKPGINTYSRSIFPELVEQIALHHPERRSEVLDWYKEVIQFFLNSSIEDNVIDSGVLGFIIIHIVNLNGTELLPEIKKLFDRGLVSTFICGDWEKVNEYIIIPQGLKHKRNISTMVECYNDFNIAIAEFIEEDSSWEFDNESIFNDFNTDEGHIRNFSDLMFSEPVTFVRDGPKIGRNEPCPCGSGKKYKKCCLSNPS